NRRIAAAPLETRPKLKNSYGVQRTLTLYLKEYLFLIATEPFYKGNCDNCQIHKANPNKKAT
ncbi:hypothetical protein KSB07_15140, partial [Acinetobacter junii]|uniref:hypothetical protein n=1 Tax=Acinetobacter junii TaxID=40215 RepID=UPI001F25E685